MKNKYISFLETVNQIERDRARKNCLSLINAAQDYYSRLMWYEELKEINNKLSSFGLEKKKGKSLICHYTMLMCYEYIHECKKLDMEANEFSAPKYGFKDFIEEFVLDKDWKDKNNNYLLFKEYPELENIKFKKLIVYCLTNYRRTQLQYKKKKNTDKAKNYDSEYAEKRHTSLEQAVNIYFNNQHMKIYDEETAFNTIFSEKFINYFNELVNDKKAVPEINIAPIRKVLTTNLGKNHGYGEYFDITIDKSYIRLNDLCNGIIEQYRKNMNKIYVLNKWFVKLENDIK